MSEHLTPSRPDEPPGRSGILFDLSGRVALVAGGAGALGQAICRGLASQGARVLVSDLVSTQCQALVAALEPAGGTGHRAIAADLSTPSGCNVLADYFAAQPRLDIVVHCIGLTSAVPLPGYACAFEHQTLEAWETALKANLTSGFLLAKTVGERLKTSPCASFVFLDSIYGLVGPQPSLYADLNMGNPVAYGASKGGLLQLMRYLATLWAPEIRVNCVSPGGVRRGQDPAFVRRYEERTPLRRMATEADVVGPVLFLAGDASRYVTGHNLVVDGGWTAW